MNDRFDLEQGIMECWGITQDIELVNENVLERNITLDEISNALLGLKTIYEMRFNKLWDIFENVVATDFKELKELREITNKMEQQVRDLKDELDLRKHK